MSYRGMIYLPLIHLGTIISAWASALLVSDDKGNARASSCGTGNNEFHAFCIES